MKVMIVYSFFYFKEKGEQLIKEDLVNKSRPDCCEERHNGTLPLFNDEYLDGKLRLSYGLHMV